MPGGSWGMSAVPTWAYDNKSCSIWCSSCFLLFQVQFLQQMFHSTMRYRTWSVKWLYLDPWWRISWNAGIQVLVLMKTQIARWPRSELTRKGILWGRTDNPPRGKSSGAHGPTREGDVIIHKRAMHQKELSPWRSTPIWTSSKIMKMGIPNDRPG